MWYLFLEEVCFRFLWIDVVLCLFDMVGSFCIVVLSRWLRMEFIFDLGVRMIVFVGFRFWDFKDIFYFIYIFLV